MKQLRKKEVKKYFKDYPKRSTDIVLVLENIQYATNVANIFRTSESAGVKKIYLSGATKTPPFGKDLKKVSKGAENVVKYQYISETEEVLNNIKREGYLIIGIEVTDNNIQLKDLKSEISDFHKVCFVAGSEVSGISKKILSLCDKTVTIPMYGKNASLNVNVSVGIVLFSF